MKLKRKIFFLSFLVGAIAIFIFFGFIYLSLSSFVHRQKISTEKKLYIKEKRASLMEDYHAREVTLKTTDGLDLAGLLIERKNARYAVIIAHGYRMTKECMSCFVTMFSDATLLLFDLRAHGQSDGNLVSFGLHEWRDIVAAVSFLRGHEGTKKLPIIGLGFSMGAAALLNASAHGVAFQALILDSCFAHLDKQIERSFAKVTGMPCFVYTSIARRLFEYELSKSIISMNPAEDIKKITVPVLIVHSNVDTFIPVEDALELYNNAGDGKKIWLLKSSSNHNAVCREWSEEYKKQIEQFLTVVI